MEGLNNAVKAGKTRYIGISNCFAWQLAKANYYARSQGGVTKAEAAAIITHAAFYVGWPKGWAVFRLAKDVWNEETPN